MNIHLSKHC